MFTFTAVRQFGDAAICFGLAYLLFRYGKRRPNGSFSPRDPFWVLLFSWSIVNLLMTVYDLYH